MFNFDVSLSLFLIFKKIFFEKDTFFHSDAFSRILRAHHLHTQKMRQCNIGKKETAGKKFLEKSENKFLKQLFTNPVVILKKIFHYSNLTYFKILFLFT